MIRDGRAPTRWSAGLAQKQSVNVIKIKQLNFTARLRLHLITARQMHSQPIDCYAKCQMMNDSDIPSFSVTRLLFISSASKHFTNVTMTTTAIIFHTLKQSQNNYRHRNKHLLKDNQTELTIAIYLSNRYRVRRSLMARATRGNTA